MWSAPFTAVTGATITAASHNTGYRDNLNAIWVYTAAGSIAYSTSSSALAELLKGPAYQLLRMNAGVTAPEWGGIIAKRQGGDASVWRTTGTTNYVPPTALVQIGIVVVVCTTFQATKLYYGSQAIAFPIAYSAAPIIFCTDQYAGFLENVHLGVSSVTTTGFTINAEANDPMNFLQAGWLAIGAP